MASKLSVGSEFPKGVKFTYVPYSKESADIKSCGAPIQLDLDKVLSNKKVVIVGVPGAFTPPCSEQHIPPYGKHYEDFKKKGVDEIIVTSANDAFVLSAWAKVLGLNEKFKFASDPNIEFATSVGLDLDATSMGLGTRTKRFALIVNNGKIEYIGVDGIEPKESSAETVLSKL